MLRTARSLPPMGLLTLGFDLARFQTKPPACYWASWQLPRPDFHRLATADMLGASALQEHRPEPGLSAQRAPDCGS